MESINQIKLPTQPSVITIFRMVGTRSLQRHVAASFNIFPPKALQLGKCQTADGRIDSMYALNAGCSTL